MARVSVVSRGVIGRDPVSVWFAGAAFSDEWAIMKRAEAIDSQSSQR